MHRKVRKVYRANLVGWTWNRKGEKDFRTPGFLGTFGTVRLRFLTEFRDSGLPE